MSVSSSRSPSSKIEAQLRTSLFLYLILYNISDEAVKLVDGEYAIGSDEDLNNVSLVELARKKEIMEESFNKNLVRPGDPGFVYDHRVDYSSGPKARSEWDDEDEEEEEEFKKSWEMKPKMPWPGPGEWKWTEKDQDEKEAKQNSPPPLPVPIPIPIESKEVEVYKI
jgi:hypothetical protein